MTTINEEAENLRKELRKEKKRTDFYKNLYEEEKLRNEHLHNALLDLRKRCEKWYNSTEMEEEMIVNKVQ